MKLMDEIINKKVESYNQISIGDKIIHSEFGEFEVILNIQVDEVKWIRIMYEGRKSKIIDFDREIELQSTLIKNKI